MTEASRHEVNSRLRRLTRAEVGDTCPEGYQGPKRPHDWLETTLPGDMLRTFGCDTCKARATELPEESKAGLPSDHDAAVRAISTALMVTFGGSAVTRDTPERIRQFLRETFPS